jgi:hypothetical protein
VQRLQLDREHQQHTTGRIAIVKNPRIGVLAGALTLLTAVVAALAFPASVSAKTQPAIAVKPNQVVTVTEPGLPGVGYAYGRAKDVGDYHPDYCGDGGTGEAVCDYFPVRADVTPEQQRQSIYLLLFTLDWPGDNVSVPAVITAANPQLTLTIWEDPIVADEEPTPPCDDPQLTDGVPDPVGATCPAPEEEKPGGDEPLFQTSIGDPKPLRWGTLLGKRTTYSAIVTNYAGVNDEYTLTVELVEVEGSPDLSIDEQITDLSALDQSVDRPAPSTPTFDGFGSPGAGSGDVLAGLGLADLEADTTLDRLGIAGDDALGFDEDTARLLASRNVRDIRPPGDEKTWALLLWLVFVPLAAAGGALFWGLRRRASLLSSI